MFYHYHQNNSGGSFGKPAINVIIEADDAQDADYFAKKKAGLYFNGVSAGRDCECCGDRWSEQWGEGTEVPSVYGEPLEQPVVAKYGDWSTKEIPYARVYYKNGTTKDFTTKRK